MEAQSRDHTELAFRIAAAENYRRPGDVGGVRDLGPSTSQTLSLLSALETAFAV